MFVFNGTITYNFDESPIPFDTITYSVRDYEGCVVLGQVYIYVENLRNPIYNLPNYFTPNGDDFNDYFVIKNKNILVGYVVHNFFVFTTEENICVKYLVLIF